MEQKNENLDIVLRKLRKLKAMYEGAKKINSENEAATAAFLMQKLLTEYNLTMEQVGEEKADNPVLQEESSSFTYKSIGGKWELHLTHILCVHNYCRCLSYSGTHRMIIIGRKENVEIVKWMREMLSERYVKFSKDRYKEFCENQIAQGYKPFGKDKFQRSYLVGCVMGLDAKLKAEKLKDKATQSEEYKNKVSALVVKNDAALDTYIAEKFGTLRSGRRSHIGSSQAYSQGYEEGRRTSLNRPINGGLTGTRLLK